MCGIVGILSKREVSPIIFDGLKRLEYRGYDSAGIATLVNGHIDRRRAEGKLHNLAVVLEKNPLPGCVGIGHTRWATHGEPSERNAHPHMTDRVAIVHNGIIENYTEIKDELIAEGHRFETETDSEVIAHLLTHQLCKQKSPEEAMDYAVSRMKGAYAIAAIIAGRYDMMLGARKGCPLVVGYGEQEMYIGSDALALAPMTQRVCYLEDGDWVVIRTDGAAIYHGGKVVDRPIKQTGLNAATIGKGNFRHYMLKEIHEQPAAIGETLHGYLNPLNRSIKFPDLPFDLAEIQHLTIVACGTAYLAGLTAKYWFEEIARLPVEVDIASEFRYRMAPMLKGSGCLVISQSGETADTLEAMRYAQSQGVKALALVNVPESTIAREADGHLMTLAGPEIGVASTKALTAQFTALFSLALAAGRARKTLNPDREQILTNGLMEIPALLTRMLEAEPEIRDIASRLTEKSNALFLGRGNLFPIALEGALKLKELSYIHAEGFASGEMKHGPVALVDENLPVIMLVQDGPLLDKAISNLEVVRARGGQLIIVTDADNMKKLGDSAFARITVPKVDPALMPFVYVVPLQLLAYHTAYLKGTDVDQPRNLAKSVTVE